MINSAGQIPPGFSQASPQAAAAVASSPAPGSRAIRATQVPGKISRAAKFVSGLRGVNPKDTSAVLKLRVSDAQERYERDNNDFHRHHGAYASYPKKSSYFSKGPLLVL